MTATPCLFVMIIFVTACLSASTIKPSGINYCQFFSDGTYACYRHTRDAGDDENASKGIRGQVGVGAAVKGTWSPDDGFWLELVTPRKYIGTCKLEKDGKGYTCFRVGGLSTSPNCKEASCEGSPLFQGKKCSGKIGGALKTDAHVTPYSSTFCQFFSDGTYNCYNDTENVCSHNGDGERVAGRKDEFGNVDVGAPIKGTWKTADGFFKPMNPSKPKGPFKYAVPSPDDSAKLTRKYVGSCLLHLEMKKLTAYTCSPSEAVWCPTPFTGRPTDADLAKLKLCTDELPRLAVQGKWSGIIGERDVKATSN